MKNKKIAVLIPCYNEEITIEELARKCGTISYELLSTISRRVPRKYRK